MHLCIQRDVWLDNVENLRPYILTSRRKTKFPTVKPPIYLPKWQIWMQLSLNIIFFFHSLAYLMLVECSSFFK